MEAVFSEQLRVIRFLIVLVLGYKVTFFIQNNVFIRQEYTFRNLE